MSDLHGLLRDLERDFASQAQGAPEFSLGAARRSVRTKRLVRTSVNTTAAVALVGTLGAGGWAVSKALADAPAVTSSASPSPSASPTAEPSPTATPGPSVEVAPLAGDDRGTEMDPVWMLTAVDYPLPDGSGDLSARWAGTRGAIDIVIVADDRGNHAFFEVRDGAWFLVAHPEGNPGFDEAGAEARANFLANVPGSALDFTTRYTDFSPVAGEGASPFSWEVGMPGAFQPAWWWGTGALPTAPAERAKDLVPQDLATSVQGDWIPDGLAVTTHRRGIAGPGGMVWMASVLPPDADGAYRPLPVGQAPYPSTTVVTVSGLTDADYTSGGATLIDGRPELVPLAESPAMQMVLADPHVDTSQMDFVRFTDESVYLTNHFPTDDHSAPSVILVPTDTEGTYEVWVVSNAVIAE